MLQNYLELSVNEFYAHCQKATTYCQFRTNRTPYKVIFHTPCTLLKKGVITIGLDALSFLSFSWLSTKTG